MADTENDEDSVKPPTVKPGFKAVMKPKKPLIGALPKDRPIHVVVSPSKKSQLLQSRVSSGSDSGHSSMTVTGLFPNPTSKIERFLNNILSLYSLFKTRNADANTLYLAVESTLKTFTAPDIKDVLLTCNKLAEDEVSFPP